MDDKRLIALLLALMMLFTLPFCAGAESGGECPSELAAEENGGQHRYSLTGEQAATCTEVGHRQYTCEYCGAQRQEEIPAPGQVFSAWSVNQPGSCIQQEIQWRSCVNCGQAEWRYGGYSAHAWSDWRVVLSPAAGAPGLRERQCAVCGTVQQEILREGDEAAAAAPAEEETASAVVSPAASLVLNAAAQYPKESYSLDMLGRTEYIPYILTITNLQDQSCGLSAFSVTVGETTQVYPVERTSLAPGTSISFPYYHQFTKADILEETANDASLGYVMIAFSAVGFAGEEEVSASQARLMHRISARTPENVLPPQQDIASQVLLSSVPSQTQEEAWKVGEAIPYHIEITNRSNTAISALTLREWPHAGQTEARFIDTLKDMQPGESRALDYAYTVTAEDAAQGYVYMLLSASWVDASSGTVAVCCASPWTAPALRAEDSQAAASGLSLALRAVNPPQNGAYYTPGETVQFTVTAGNKSERALHQVTIQNPANQTILASIDTLAPGEEKTYTAFYGITQLDAALGRAALLAWAKAQDEGGSETAAASSPLLLSVGGGEKAAVTVLQKVKNLPKNGVAFQFGEKIAYEITVIGAGQDITALTVYSSLDASVSSSVGEAEALGAGEIFRCGYEHTVTAEEAEAGYIISGAYAAYETESGSGFEAVKEPAVSRTGAAVASSAQGGRLSLPIADSGDYCALTLTAKGANAAEYTQHYCARHAAISQMVNELISQAGEGEEKAEAWQSALLLWKDEMDGLYQQYMDAAHGSARLAVAAERLAFLNYLNAFGAQLEQLPAAYPAWRAQRMAEAVMAHCAELCYGLHRAGTPRPDSLTSGAYSRMLSTGDLDACMRMTLVSPNEDVHYRHNLCAVHSAVDEGYTLLIEQNGEESLRQAAFLWLSALQRDLNSLYRQKEGEAQASIARFASAYAQYLAARSDTLSLLYPAAPNTAQEALALEMMAQAEEICQDWK